MVEPTDANAGYDEFVEAVADGDGFYLECANGHGSLPPRRACPRCGNAELEAVPLSTTGAVETYTVVHVATPQLAADVPYVTAVAGFGPARVTGFLRGVEPAKVEVGDPVELHVEETATAGERVLVLRPA